MAASAESQPVSRSGTAVSVMLLVAYVTVVAWVFYEQSASWPHEGSMAYLVLFLLCPGIVFQSVSLAYNWRTRLRLTRRALTRLVTIPLGLVIAAVLASWASTLAMSGFEQAYVPFVAKVGANPADACRSAVEFFGISSVAAYNRRAGREHPFGKLHHDGKRFVLAFHGGSADIDGSTISYDSGARTWRKFHNDNSSAREAYAGLTAGLAECPLRAQQATAGGAVMK
ncbi:MAG TPA: hypothetical protein VFO57_10225 [Burkholderiales bacterium]|nr:hypothetical protein [Burkholderiales bacterium]